MTSIQQYYSLRPASYGPIVRFAFSQGLDIEGGVECQLEIVLAKRPLLSSERLNLHFWHVSELQFEQSSLSLMSFGVLELHVVAEGYMVTEEEGRLRFRCSRFSAEVSNSS